MAPHTKLSKERFLEELSKGKSVLSIFTSHGYAGNGNYYAWCREDPEFKRKAEEIRNANPEDLARRAAAAERFQDTAKTWQYNKAGRAIAETPVDIAALELADWRDKYVYRYTECQSRLNAAKFCGKGTTFIRNALNPEHDDYDSKFATMVAEMELDEAWQVEDKMKQKAVNHGDMNAIKQLLPVLPVVGEKYKKQRERDAGSVVFNLFSVGNRNRALSSIKDILNSTELEESEAGALPEPKATFVS